MTLIAVLDDGKMGVGADVDGLGGGGGMGANIAVSLLILKLYRWQHYDKYM
jgi:hypothetical protein